MEVIERRPHPGAVPRENGRESRSPRAGHRTRTGVRQLIIRFGVAVGGLAGVPGIANAHGLAHGGVGTEGHAVGMVVVLGAPTLASLVGGFVALRYRHIASVVTSDRGAYVAVGLLLVGLGAASLLPAVTGRPLLSVAGGTVGAVAAVLVAGGGTSPKTGSRNHPDLALGAIATHRLFEGLVVGTLYSEGAALGVLAAVVIAGHAAIETAGVGSLYVTSSRRTGAMVSIPVVQATFLVGAGAGLGVSGAVPPSLRTFVLAAVGGTLLVLGADEVEQSVTAG